MKKLYSILEGVFDIDDKLVDTSVDLALGKYLSNFSGHEVINCKLNGHKLFISGSKDASLFVVDPVFFEAAQSSGVKEIKFDGSILVRRSKEIIPAIIDGLTVLGQNLEFHTSVVMKNSTLHGKRIRFYGGDPTINTAADVTLQNAKIIGESNVLSIYFRRINNVNIDKQTRLEGPSICFCYDAYTGTPSLIKGTPIGNWIENQGVVKFSKINGIKWLQKDPKNFKIHIEPFPYKIKTKTIRVEFDKSTKSDILLWSKKEKFTQNWETDAGWNFGYQRI